MREHGQDGPAAPGRPAADLVLVQGGEFLAAGEAFFDLPADAGDADQFGEGNRAWGVGAVDGVFAGRRTTGWPRPGRGLPRTEAMYGGNWSRHLGDRPAGTPTGAPSRRRYPAWRLPMATVVAGRCAVGLRARCRVSGRDKRCRGRLNLVR